MNPGDLVSGKYRLQRLLGAGSMGSVWAARNELTNHDFAVKFLLPSLVKNQEAMSRFFHEARACGQIRHPAIVDVFDMGHAEDGSPYLVMELLEGEGFDQRLNRQGRIPAIDVCRWMAQVARGLDEAHTRGLIHRDLKPGNIFFSVDGGGDATPKVLDFGISKELRAQDFNRIKTNTGMVLGSPAYMSPEQARGDDEVDARSDVWSLGVMMYEALSGVLPFDASNYNALMLCIISEAHIPVSECVPEVPLELSRLIDDTLAKDRDHRLGTAGQLADRLERIYSKMTTTPLTRPERSLSIPPRGPSRSTQKAWYGGRANDGKSRWRPVLVVGAISLSVLAVGAGGALMLVSEQPPAAVPPVSRFSSGLAAAMARATHEYDRAVTATKAEQEAAAQAAAQQDADADKPTKPSSGASKPAPKNDPNDPHGGIHESGF